MKQSLQDKLLSRDSKTHEFLRDSLLSFLWESIPWDIKRRVTLSVTAKQPSTAVRYMLYEELSNHDLQKR